MIAKPGGALKICARTSVELSASRACGARQVIVQPQVLENPTTTKRAMRRLTADSLGFVIAMATVNSVQGKLAMVATVLLVHATVSARRQRRRHESPTKSI